MSRPLSPTTVALMKARDLIKSSSRWCAGRYYESKPGVPPRYCAHAALQLSEDWGMPTYFASRAAAKLYDEPLVTVNDRLGHAAVMECFDLAIQRSMEEAT